MAALIIDCWHTDLYSCMLLTDGLMLNWGFCSCWLQVKAGIELDLISYKKSFYCLQCISPLEEQDRIALIFLGELGILCYIFHIIYSLLGFFFLFGLVSWLDLLLPRLSLDTLVAPSLCNSSLICYTGKTQPCRRETTSILQLWRCHAAYLFPPLLSRTAVAHMLWPV